MTEEYFVHAYTNKQGHKIKITHLGKGMTDPYRLYVDGKPTIEGRLKQLRQIATLYKRD